MRDLNENKGLFGRADDGFENRVYRTLAGLPQREEKTVKRSRFKLAVAVALCCMMITATAFALTNPWGIFDFLNRHPNAVAPPIPEEILQKDVIQQGGDSAVANFTVREAVYDGKEVFIALATEPASGEYLLLGNDSYPADPVGDLGPLFAGQEGTIGEYAEENNKKLIHTWAGISGLNCSIDFLLEEDGTLVYLINGTYEAEGKAQLEVACGVAPFVEKDGKLVVDHNASERTPVAVTLENTGTEDQLVSAASAEYADVGVRVDRITMTGSPMRIYARIEYTVIDADKYAATDDGLWFEFLDENGEVIRSTGGKTLPPEDGGTRFVQEITLRAAETLPKEVTLRGYNCWEKNRYEVHTFEMN